MNALTGGTGNPKILIAEDDCELRELLVFSLTRAGYRVDSCSNGLALLEQLEKSTARHAEPYQVVITDIRMPVLTGLEVLEVTLDFPGRPHFICMTAFGDNATHTNATKLGAKLIIDKPFQIDQLIDMINSLCKSGERENTQHRSAL